MARNRFTLGEPAELDTTFDSVPQIRPPRLSARLALPRPAQPAAAVPSPLNTVAAQPAVAPTLGTGQIQPEPPPAEPPPAPPTAPATDPSLNFEGTTFQPSEPATSTTYAPNEFMLDELLGSLESFTGTAITPKWRELARTNPEELLRQVRGIVDYLKQAGPLGGNADTTFRQRMDDWFSNFQNALRQPSTATNPDAERERLRQQAFNQGRERLTQGLGFGAREDEEALLGLLAERGLLNSGIASRELANLQASRTKNYNDGIAALNQMLTLGELNYLDSASLAKLQAALQFGNEKALLELKAKLERENAADPLAQIIGSIVGAGIGFALSPGSPKGTPVSGPLALGQQRPIYTG